MTTLLDSLRAAVDDRRAPGPQERAALVDGQDPALLRRAGQILADLRPDDGVLRPIRVAVLGTSTIGPFRHLVRATLVGAGLLPDVEEGAYGGFEMALGGATFAEGTDPDLVVCVLDESYFLPHDWAAADVGALSEHVQARLADLRALVGSACRRSTATVVLHTVPLPAPVPDTLISWRSRTSLLTAWYRLNADLLGLAAEHARVVVADLVGALADGPVAARDDRLHRYADLPYTDGALLCLAQLVRRIAQARAGLSRKVLAVDLDNTLWGGVLGEVGAHEVQLGGLYPGNCYTELQRTVRRLREQGVVLVLTSKNDEDLVADAIDSHPEMLLRSDAFSVTAVNWAAKAKNLGQAAQALGLSTEAFVFLDDSAFELGQVRGELPAVATVAAGGDPAHLVRSLVRSGWFDVVTLTDTDRARPQLYRSRALRSDFSAGFGTSEEYLHALAIELTAGPVDRFGLARVAQLAVRTNQFNLTGVRFDQAATAAMSQDPHHLVAAFSVRDRFGDEGVVGAAWVARDRDAWRVRNLVLSCRVLGRGVELAVAGWLARQARRAGARTLEGRFVPSGRNGVAAGFWDSAGFARTGTEGAFALDLTSAPDPTPGWITVRERSDAA